jgi:hypothetical protein
MLDVLVCLRATLAAVDCMQAVHEYLKGLRLPGRQGLSTDTVQGEDGTFNIIRVTLGKAVGGVKEVYSNDSKARTLKLLHCCVYVYVSVCLGEGEGRRLANGAGWVTGVHAVDSSSAACFGLSTPRYVLDHAQAACQHCGQRGGGCLLACGLGTQRMPPAQLDTTCGVCLQEQASKHGKGGRGRALASAGRQSWLSGCIAFEDVLQRGFA